MPKERERRDIVRNIKEERGREVTERKKKTVWTTDR